MATKLAQSTYPAGTSADEFECYGPPATKDGEFSGTKIADFGCFDQPVNPDEKRSDTNKYYHTAVTKHKNGKWFAYFEWGRTGAGTPSFQFIECFSEEEAQKEYEKQCHAKNDKRGQWVTIASIKTLQPKPGKDCYLVRPMAARSTGLPSAKTIKMNDGAKVEKVPEKKVQKSVKKIKIDTQTISLLRDLGQATLTYTRSSMADASLPTQTAIDEARTLLIEAKKRVIKLKSLDDQTKDKDLLDITKLLYGRIPKKKPVGAAASTWVLSQDNIVGWEQDLDAFESALYTEVEDSVVEDNPYGDMKIEMEWIDPKSVVGKFLYDWWPKASANRHSHVGNMKIRNMWKVGRFDEEKNVSFWQEKVEDDLKNNNWKIKDRPPFQPTERNDLTTAEWRRYQATNTSLMYHGTRTINVSGIMRSGLRLPKQLVGVSINGAAFGPGVYWAADWRKSAGYTSLTSSYWAGGSGGIKGRGAFMFAADVVLGMPWYCKHTGGYIKPDENKHHIWAKPGITSVANDEFIIFDTRQNSLRYLCEFEA